MTIFKTLITFIFCLSIILLYTGCGSDPAAEGEKAMQNGEYALAVKHFMEAKKKNPQNQTYDEKIALALMHRGEELFGRTKNIKSLSGNFEKGLEYIPEEPSPEFKKEYSKILYVIGKAYLETKPENEKQKKEFLTMGMDYLEDAVYNDETNEEANKLLTDFKSKNFKKMMDRGMEYFNRAKKTDSGDDYLSAEYYFKKAVDFDPENKEAQTYLSKTRKITMTILNYQEDLTFGIAADQRNSDNLVLEIVMQNFTNTPFKIIVDNFELIDQEGNSYPIDKERTKKYASILKDQEIKGGKQVKGVMAFTLPKTIKLECISYTRENGEVVKKYFP